jgi:peptidoglycan/xylan/chitin deacetylase (PgdA/CDA1 family)
MSRLAPMARLLVGLVLVSPLVAGAHPAAARERPTTSTTVSFTFTGGYRGQEAAAQILARHDMQGTFYVSSRFIGLPDYLAGADLRSIAASGSEIGGGTVSHRDLATMTDRKVLQEICADRSILSSWGFPVTSFAYPHGSWSYAAQAAAQKCGYNSARGLAQLRVSNTHCSACPPSESLPPLNAYELRTTSPRATVVDLETVITHAQQSGGGWVLVAVDRVCRCPDRGHGALTPEQFEQLVRWVSARPAVRVRTVNQVVGGPVRPVPPVSDAQITQAADIRRDDVSPLSRRPAWTVLGVGIGQVQILFSGLLMATAVVGTYRVATRGSRYGR